MKTRLEYDPTQYSEKVNHLVMLTAERLQCTPGEALAQLLDALAEKELEKEAA